MDNTFVFLLLWLVLALVAGLAISRLMKLIHFPNVTGFLIVGIIIGPWVLGLFNQSAFTNIVDNLEWVDDVALGFIAFVIGNSFKVSALKEVGKKATIISILEALGASILVSIVLFVGYFLGLKDVGAVSLTIPMILTLSAISCATAPAATLMIIKQYSAKGPVTNTLLPVVAFDDAVALIVFSILFAIAKTIQAGVSFNFVDGILVPLLEIVASLAIGVGIGFLVSLGTNIFHSRHNRMICIIAGVFLAVAISLIEPKSLFGWSFSFQTSALLTSMAVGAIYANFAKDIDITYEFLDKFTAPLFMLFFIVSGAKLNFGVFASEGALIILVIAAIYITSRVLGKISGSALGAAITKSEPNVKKYLGFALIPQAGVALGLASSAQTFYQTLESGKEIGSIIYTIIIVSTMIYELVGPLFTKWALTKSGEITNG